MRLGTLPYLNVKPLTYGLERGDFAGVGLVSAPPSKLAEMLADNEIAAAPVSSFATFLHPHWGICPDICIASNGAVDSVLMLTRMDIGKVDTVAIDSSSLSGASMLRIVLKELHKVEPHFERVSLDTVDHALQSHDAVMLIGDPAFTASRDGLNVLDLGESWRRLTGLPAVFALWAGPGMDEKVERILHESKEAGMAALDEIASLHCSIIGEPEGRCLNYLTETIHYDLGKDEQESLEVFRDMAIKHGILRG